MFGAIEKRINSVLRANLYPSDRLALCQQITLLALAILMLIVAGWKIALTIGLVILLLILLMIGNSTVVASVFALYLLFSHQYYSPFIIALGGVECHPRELILMLFIVHGLWRFPIDTPVLRASVLHVGIALLMTFFLCAALVGEFRGGDLKAMVAELRSPMFLAAYPFMLVCLNTVRSVTQTLRLIGVFAVLVAVASISFFLYATISGNTIQLNQTPLGEIMRYPFGDRIVQMVRPNGHAIFEMAITICMSVIISRNVRLRTRFLASGLLIIFVAALIITFMRTAYVATLVSLALLILLALPAKLRGLLVLLLSVIVLVLILHAFSARIYPEVDMTTNFGTSIRGRFVEIEGALREFRQYPLFGSGLGGSYETLSLAQPGEQLAAITVKRSATHNAWVYFMYKGGAIGLGSVLLAYGVMIAGMCSIWSGMRVGCESALLRGMLAAFIGQLVASLAMPRLLYAQGYVLVALVMTVFYVFSLAENASACPTGRIAEART